MTEMVDEFTLARVLILGDICPEWGFPELFASGNAERVFHDILPLMAGADYVVANLEAPATRRTERLEKNSVNLKARPEDVKLLADVGVKAVALANNHILDYGVEGLNDTLKVLNQAGIACYGAGDAQMAARSLTVDLSGIRVGFLAFAEREFNCAVDYRQGANMWDDLDGIRAIWDAKRGCDYLVVQYHGGIEHYIYPSPRLQKKCRAMAEAGADLILCQHSHIVGTREEWHGSEILYGQGNTIFGYEGNPSWDRGLACVVELEKTVDGMRPTVSYVPIVASPDGERLASEKEAADVLGNMEEASFNLKDSSFIQDRWNEFCASQASEYLPMLFGWRLNFIRANKVLKGRLVSLLVGRKQRRNVMNLVRCDAHREVVETILGNQAKTTLLRGTK